MVSRSRKRTSTEFILSQKGWAYTDKGATYHYFHYLKKNLSTEHLKTYPGTANERESIKFKTEIENSKTLEDIVFNKKPKSEFKGLK